MPDHLDHADPDDDDLDATRARVRVILAGKVQGVWFRESTREQATALALGGWVRNLADGTVEAVFEGSETAVDRAVEWCRRGPRQARIDSVVVTGETPIGEVSFAVR